MTRAGAIGIAAAAAAALALAAPTSAGAIRFAGETAKGVKVELRASPRGKPRRFEVAPTKVRCEDGTLRHDRRRFADFDRARAGHFADRFKQRIPDGPVVLRERTRYEGDVRQDGSWSGTYEVKVRVFRSGERIDTCKLRTTWTAKRRRAQR